MTREEYFTALETHDWYYQMSDSGEVYARGKSQVGRLKAEAEQDPEKMRMLQAFFDFYFPPRATKPTREEFGL